MPERSKPNEIRLTRLYDAPVAAVWDAWADPAQVAQWWGPRGFTITHHAKDLRPGGAWSYTMHGPDGTNWPSKHVYHEVVTHQKLVYDHGGNDDQPPLFRVSVTFAEQPGGKTLLDMTMALATPEAAEETRKRVKKYGGNSTWDRLAEYLLEATAGAKAFVIARSFEAPRDVVFRMWADPAHVSRWLPPTGFDMKFLRVDLRPGGGGVYVMTGGNGMKMYGRTHYLEIREPDRLVYTQQFLDEHENVSRHPMLKTWPATMLTTVTLAEEGPDQTRVTVKWEPHGPTTPDEVDAFTQMRGSMTQGWTGSFDKLDGHLASEGEAVKT